MTGHAKKVPDATSCQDGHYDLSVTLMSCWGFHNRLIIFASFFLQPYDFCSRPYSRRVSYRVGSSGNTALPSLVTKNIKLHSLQYQIFHRYFACNYNLNIWNIGDDPTCPYCSEIDTIEHYVLLLQGICISLGKFKTVEQLYFKSKL